MFKSLVRLFKKWGCNHKWNSHAKSEVQDAVALVKGNGTISTVHDHKRTTEILFCENCGEIRKIEY